MPMPAPADFPPRLLMKGAYMKLGKISALARCHMKQRGISLTALDELIRRGEIECQLDGAQVVFLDHPPHAPARSGRPQPRLYAIVDAAGEVLTVERRVRRGDASSGVRQPG